MEQRKLYRKRFEVDDGVFLRHIYLLNLLLDRLSFAASDITLLFTIKLRMDAM